MADINGFIFMIVGVIVAVFYKIVDNNTYGESFTLFFFIGIIMAVSGGIKLFLLGIRKPKKKQQVPHYNKVVNPVHSQGNFRYCPGCGTPVTTTSHFCYKCGRQLQ